MTQAGGDAPQAVSYNRVLEHYVGADADRIDLVGMVAYALYKRQKRDWLVLHRRQHGGREPSADETAALTRAYMTEDLRLTLYERATDMLGDYARTFVEAAEPKIREDAIASEALRQARDIERSITQESGFAKQVATGLVATALWTLLVLALVLTSLVFGSDLVDAWAWVTGRAG